MTIHDARFDDGVKVANNPEIHMASIIWRNKRLLLHHYLDDTEFGLIPSRVVNNIFVSF